MEQYNPIEEKQVPLQDTGPQLQSYSNDLMIHPVEVFLPQAQQPNQQMFQSPVISKSEKKKMNQTSMQSAYMKSVDTMYQNYSLPDICSSENRMQCKFRIVQSSIVNVILKFLQCQRSSKRSNCHRPQIILGNLEGIGFQRQTVPPPTLNLHHNRSIITKFQSDLM